MMIRRPDVLGTGVEQILVLLYPSQPEQAHHYVPGHQGGQAG